jgi:hypothetical protein
MSDATQEDLRRGRKGPMKGLPAVLVSSPTNPLELTLRWVPYVSYSIPFADDSGCGLASAQRDGHRSCSKRPRHMPLTSAAPGIQRGRKHLALRPRDRGVRAVLRSTRVLSLMSLAVA